MTVEQQKHIEQQLFHYLSEITDPADRDFFLDWVCREDGALRQRMHRLLDSEHRSGRFFDFAPFETCDADEEEASAGGEDEIGLRIGKYRLIRRLGAGGCGVVYLAEQETPVRRQVALKLIRVGLDHEEVCRRFEAERQSLAMMDHPGIARVLDAGTTTTGRPFFVMQWVDGECLTAFCDNHRLGLRARLELFIRVCHAIQHAHQKGVIHRDIKPSNILVTDHDGTPLPKVIDFGIAKATGGTETEADPERIHRYLLGTPDYMSPEQALQHGADVDTRTDIFSLGVLLCELIAAVTPFPSRADKGLEPSAFQATAPSAVFASLAPGDKKRAAENRNTHPAALAECLAGDLDAIVLKCVQRDPKDRYTTAHSLAADVRHYLKDEPVGAHPSSRSYRLSKLVRRNKLAFIAGTIVFLALGVGFGTSTALFLREKSARREQARLRLVAEESRAAEASLRGRAEARELCTQAAVRLMYGKMQEADEIAARIPEQLVPSSLEAADLFGRLGHWHVSNSRWPEASRCFSLLVEAFSSVDPSDTDNVSQKLLPAVAAACQAGDWPRYEQLRRIALQRFGGTQHPVVAEQIIKVCLLRPAEAEMMRELAPLCDLVAGALTKNPPAGTNANLQAWGQFSMALWSLRQGDWALAFRWSQESLDTENGNTARVASVKLLQALVHFHAKDSTQARLCLEEARQVILAVVELPIRQWTNSPGGVVWPDWVNAQVLLHEVENLVDPAQGK